VYEFVHGAIVRAYLSMPAYHDFRQEQLEVWTLDLHIKGEKTFISRDIPRRRLDFEPIISRRNLINEYTLPNAAKMVATKKVLNLSQGWELITPH
jgi:hypothetical protein